MKARIRNTNIEVDVQPFYDETGYFAGFKDGYEYYRAADLVFPDTSDWDKTDWSSFRIGAAKDILCAVVSHTGGDANIKRALELADTLIEALKKE